MQIGYARVSTQEQDTQAQIVAFRAAGCELLFQEKASGGRWDRLELHWLLSQLRKSDVVVVWKLDRLSRSLKDLLLTLEKIESAGAEFKSLTEAIDTTTSRWADDDANCGIIRRIRTSYAARTHQKRLGICA